MLGEAFRAGMARDRLPDQSLPQEHKKTMTIGRVNPAKRLEDQGINGLGNVYYNLIEPAIIEEAIKRGEGELGKGGAFLCSTGKFTGRSPKDKHVVRSAATENTIWWDNNAPCHNA